MTSNNQILMNLSLKRFFTLIFFAENELGEVHDFSYKMKKSKFQELVKDKNFYVTVVEDFPFNIERETLYIKKTGKMAWLQTNENFIDKK